MANLAQIQSIAQGQFFVKDSLGNLTELKVGDTVSLNDTIVAASSNTDLSKIEILFDTNELITLSQGEQLLDATLLASTFGNEELAFDKQEVDETLNAWNNAQDGDATDMETAAGDVTEQATNAGDERAADGGALRSKFNSRDGSSTDVRSDLRDTSFGGGNTEEPQEQIPTELLNPVGTTTPGSISGTITPFTTTVTVGDTTVNEDATSATVAVKLEGHIFKDGEIVTVRVGDKDVEFTSNTTQNVTFTVTPDSDSIREEDSTKDITATVTSNKGTIENPVVNNGKLTVEDFDNQTTVTVGNTTVNEDATSATVAVKLEGHIFKDGEIVTVRVGDKDVEFTSNTTQNVTFTVTPDSDSIIEADSTKDITATVTSNKGTIENPVVNNGKLTVEDFDNQTTVTLTATAEVNEDNNHEVDGVYIGNAITYTAKLPDGVTANNAITVTLSVGANGEPASDTNPALTITIPKYGNSGTVIADKVNRDNNDGSGEDKYIESDSLSAKITGVSEANAGSSGSFENLTFDNSEVVTTITDDKDPTTVTITAAKVTDKVITKDNFENNQGFTVKAKDPYGNDAKISTHTGPAGFGVESLAETKSVFLGQTDKVYSGHTSEIGVVEDGGSYKSESIEVVFKNPVHTLDVAFAWRHNGETAKVDFYNGNEKVGYAIVKGGGNDTLATIEYYDKNGNLKDTVNAQGGTDNVDLVYTFKPVGDVTFTKAVFSADGAGSDYLIHSISYKEVSEGDSTTIVGSDEVAFKISTSNIPDPSKYDFKTTFPTADVKIVDKNTGEVLFNRTVNLDKDGKAIVTVRTDGTKDLKAEVSNVQGNFEEVDYKNAKTEVEASIKATASNDSFDTLEDTNYVLKTTDFGDKNQNVAKIKFDSLPANGTIYVLKSEYTGSINDRAEYTSSENKVYIEVKAGDIVDISKIENGNVVFVPNKDTDADSSFNFSVSNGNGVFTGSYETKVNVIADADAPTVSIDVVKTQVDNTYDVKIEAKLTDTDGSETLTVAIKGVPAGAKLYDLDGKEILPINGEYNVTVPSGVKDISGSLTMKVPESYKGEINLEIVGRSTENDYTKLENEGGKNFATAEDTAHIDAPTIKVDPNTPNNINGGSGDDILIGDTGGASKNIVAGKNYNVALVIDTSGSMKDASGTANKSRMDLTKDALKNLADSLKGHDGKVNVSIIDFDTNAKEPITFNDLTSKNISDLITKIDALKADGGTNYEDAFLKTTSWFDTQSVTYGKAQGYENLTYFLTDGDPTFSNRDTKNNGSTTEYSDMKDAVDAFKTLSGQSTVHAIGIGNGINENYLRFFDNTDIIGKGNVSFGSWFWKQTVSGNIGKPDIVNTAEDLKAALQGGSVSEDILDVGSDTINGGDGDDIIFGDSINTDNLLWNGRFVEGHENYMSKGQGINALDKYLSLSKSGYEDMTTLEKNMAKFDYIKEHHSDLNVEGDTRGGDDIISGGAGRDIIYGQGGDDTIITDLNTNNGKADGDILIDGGAGYDVIKLTLGQDIDFSELGTVIKNIEQIDLSEKGENKLLNLSLKDVLNMTDKDNTLRITGTAEDKVTFKDNDGWKKAPSTVTEKIGEDTKTFEIYTNSGDPTVQVKVEEKISDGITS